MACGINSQKPCTVVRDSSCVTSIAVLSLVHQTEDLSLKPLKIKETMHTLKLKELAICTPNVSL